MNSDIRLVNKNVTHRMCTHRLGTSKMRAQCRSIFAFDLAARSAAYARSRRSTKKRPLSDVACTGPTTAGSNVASETCRL